MVLQMVSLLGAAMVLAGYAMIQSGWCRELDAVYLVLNILGSLLLGVVAVVERQIGFIVLEFAWAGMGVVGAARAWKLRTARPER